MGTRVTGRNEMYDPATNTWTTRSPMPTSRNHAFSGVVGGKIYVIGGRIGAGNIPATTNIDVVEEYDPATNLWGRGQGPHADAAQRRRARRPTTARSTSGAASCRTGSCRRRSARSRRTIRRPTPGTCFPSMPSARHGNAMGFIGNKLHVVSGKMEGGGAHDMAGTDHPVRDRIA